MSTRSPVRLPGKRFFLISETSLTIFGIEVFEHELARLAAVQVESLGKPEEEGTFTKVLIVLLGKLATVQVESLGKPEEEE